MLRPQAAANEPKKVSLMESSDSVRSVPSAAAKAASPFAPSTRMNKQCVRVVAQPPRPSPASQHHHLPQPPFHQSFHGYAPSPASYRSSPQLPVLSVPPMAGRSYSELVEVAEQQRRVLEQQRREEERRREMSGPADPARLHSLRRQVAEDEMQLHRLCSLEQETRSLAVRNAAGEEELARLDAQARTQQMELRAASQRVDALRSQLDELYRRRNSAAAAAMAEAGRMRVQREMASKSMEMASLARALPTPTQTDRPRASVEPFHIQPAGVIGKAVAVEEKKKVDEVIRPCELPPQSQSPLAPSNSVSSSITSLSTLTAHDDRQEISPSPPKDPHPSQPSPSPPMEKTAPAIPPPPTENTVLQKLYESGAALEVEEPDGSRLQTGRTDLVSVRSDSLRATKRRSWASSEGMMGEADAIKRFLIEEQKKGRHHFIPELPSKVIEEPIKEVEEEKEKEEMPLPSPSPAVVAKAVKGILRRPGMRKEKRRIEFDPLALLLDAALAGELDLVRASAAKLPSVSLATDEGITALHNAICAGHYDIVRFLIDAEADVNAQDSDGWTPLHCAASCNNLPMVRQLVEGGAVVLASTLSDMETPAEKCEEEDDGYDGCLRYLTAASECAGQVNGGKVYAAYSYPGEREDELAFEGGDEMAVLEKETEKGWWRCRLSNGEEGLCPRTYISLFPAVKYRKRLNFRPFEVPVEANNNEKD